MVLYLPQLSQLGFLIGFDSKRVARLCSPEWAGGAEGSEDILLHFLRMLSSSGDHNVVVNVP